MPMILVLPLFYNMLSHITTLCNNLHLIKPHCTPQRWITCKNNIAPQWVMHSLPQRCGVIIWCYINNALHWTTKCWRNCNNNNQIKKQQHATKKGEKSNKTERTWRELTHQSDTSSEETTTSSSTTRRVQQKPQHWFITFLFIIPFIIYSLLDVQECAFPTPPRPAIYFTFCFCMR